MNKTINPQNLRPLKLQVFWALSQLEDGVRDGFLISEIVSYLVNNLKVTTSSQAVLSSLKSDRRATHKIGSHYKLMQNGKDQLFEKGITEVIIKKNKINKTVFFENLKILKSLKKMDLDLGNRYLQAIHDLSDSTRISYAGTANELRETIRIVLLLKAPNNKVMEASWFKNARSGDRKNPPPGLPTQTERVRFILEERKRGQKIIETAQKTEMFIDDNLGKVVRSTYDRMNVGVHKKEDRDEIIKCLQYINAFLSDILS